MINYFDIANRALKTVSEKGKYSEEQIKICFDVYLRAMEAEEMRFHGLSEETISKRYNKEH